jgi:hypothetical protein
MRLEASVDENIDLSLDNLFSPTLRSKGCESNGFEPVIIRPAKKINLPEGRNPEAPINAFVAKIDEYRKIVKEAEDKSPTNSFVESCATFLEERGFLSPKQVEALKKIQSPRADQFRGNISIFHPIMYSEPQGDMAQLAYEQELAGWDNESDMGYFDS